MRWPDALAGWPHAERSERVLSKPHRWHVQQMGEGETLLLLHGAGGASHSWRDVMPCLSKRCHVVAIDLPGHGLTQLGSRARSGLTEMAEDVASLCDAQGWQPRAIVGHSAGCAVALRMAQLGSVHCPVIGINPALGHFKGVAGVVFPAMAKLLALAPFTADLFARGAARPERVRSLLDGTGSQIDAAGEALYAALVADRDHVNGALLMMAQWSLDPLLAGLERISVPVLFIAGDKDKTVPPDVAQRAGRKLPKAQVEIWPDLGHLLHEEAPIRVCNRVLEWLDGSESARAAIGPARTDAQA